MMFRRKKDAQWAMGAAGQAMGMVRHVRLALAVPALCLFCLPLGCSALQGGRVGAGREESFVKCVNESARELPVLSDVDVVVVGGASGAVAAAVAAAQAGANVFLAAERHYLGEDLCGTYRLWLEAGEEPKSALAKNLFAEPSDVKRLRSNIPFKYEADRESAGPHKDTQPASLLTDGKWHSAASQSVQYNADVSVIAELPGEQDVQRVRLMVYQRDNDFVVESVAVSVSEDKQVWKQAAAIRNDKVGAGSFEESGIELSAVVGEKARYVKLFFKKAANAKRVLLGEICLEGRHGDVVKEDQNRLAPTPMQVKRVLDEALLDAGVQFLFGCYVTDVLHDDDGKLAGVVMANRSGRQAVRAKVVIDATPRATVARLAGGIFSPYPSGMQTFRRIVVGGEIRKGEGIRTRQMPAPILLQDGRRYEAIEYALQIPMRDGSFASFAQAEQIARDKTWHPAQVDSSEMLFQVPPDCVKGEATLRGSWPGADEVDLDAFRPASVERLYVLGGCADVSRGAAESLLGPVEFVAVGSRMGAAAAAEAKAVVKPKHARLRGRAGAAVASGDIREELVWVRAEQIGAGFVSCDERAAPVLGEYDVVVVGGGTGGAPAGIAAARQGAKTLVIEYLYGLGGVGTVGLINKYYHGYIKGFTQEIDEGVASFGDAGKNSSVEWNVEWKMEWYRRELRKAGADIWFGTLGCGAFVENGRVRGVVVATPHGRGVVLAKVVIDSTGNADIAAAAGAQCVYTDGTDVAVQGAGLPARKLGAGYTNTDWTFVDEADVIDVWRAFVVAKEKYKGAYDLGQLVDTRERRRIVGDFVMSPLDISNNRTYPDTVVIASSDFDSHGFTVHPVFLLKVPDRSERIANVPYRCLLPKGLEGILVTGLGVSAHRDAVPVIRMQADVQNQGYAAGVAAAMAAKSDKGLRQIDIKALQKHLIQKGNLPERVLTDTDSYPLAKEKIAQAVKNVVNGFEGLEILLTQPEDALPVLREAYEAAASQESRLTYAHILGMLGDATGVEDLLKAVSSRQWDKGWNFTGMGQYGASLSELDSLIIALGRTRDKRSLGPIIEKVKQLDAADEFSHCRAVAVAIETLGDPSAAEPLAQLLNKPGMTGHAFTKIEDAVRRTPSGSADTSTRNNSLRELVVARALYRCGDYESLGRRILKEYARDLRGHYARHARAVLRE